MVIPSASSLLRPAPGISPSVRFHTARAISSSYTSTQRPPSSYPIPNLEASTSSSLYGVLGLSAGATCQEIKAAYRRLARSCHPDVVAVDRKDTSADEFVKIHAAYSTLSDPEKRADYDRKLVVVASGWQSRASSFSRASRFSCRRTWETDQCW